MSDRYASLKQGLVGCWIPSVSGSGLLLPDLSGRGNNGSLVGMDASDWVSASYGRALDFDGSDDKVTATHPLGVGVSRCTFSVWMRKTSASDIAISSIGSETANSRFHISWFSDGQLYCTVENSASSYGEFTPSFTSNFRNYCLVYDGTQATNASRLRVFLDGQQVSLSYTGTIPSTAISSNVVAIGAGSGSFSKSQQDDIRIYNRVLTEPEIRLLASEPGIGFKPAKKLSRFSQRFTYNPPKARNYGVTRVKETDYGNLRQGLVGAWCPSLPNGGSGNTLPDQSGYNNHGSLVGMGPEDWVSSQYGRALDFDGVNDKVTLSMQNTASLTASCWVYSRNINNANGEYFVVKWGPNPSVNANDFYIGAFSNNWIARSGDGSTGQSTLLQTAATANQWTHLLITRDAVNLRLFVNGIQMTSTSAVGFQGGGSRPLELCDLAGFPANGQLDDIRIYSRALTESEIKLLASKRGIGLRQESHRNTFYQFPSGARRRKILTGMP